MTPVATTLPTKAQVDAAAKSLDTALEKVRAVLAPFAGAPGIVDSTLDPERQEQFEESPGLSQVVYDLEAVQGTMYYLRTLVRYKGLRDVLKAYITAHARDFAKDRYHDDLVADLIAAATQEVNQDAYSADAHKSWRNAADHSKLIDRACKVVVSELKRGGYDIVVDDDRNVTKWEPPNRANQGKDTTDS